MRRFMAVRNEISQLDSELLKKAEMSLRDAGTAVIVVPPYIRDGKVYHPNLTEKGELRKKKK